MFTHPAYLITIFWLMHMYMAYFFLCSASRVQGVPKLKALSILMQVVTDFFDEMKSRSKGYASMEYQITGYRENKLVRLDVKVNQEVCTGPLWLTCPPTYYH